MPIENISKRFVWNLVKGAFKKKLPKHSKDVENISSFIQKDAFLCTNESLCIGKQNACIFY